MQIGDDFTETIDGNDSNQYVSWWPTEEANFTVGTALKSIFEKRKVGKTTINFKTDCVSEGYLPDHIIQLDTSTDQEDNMSAAWKAVYLKPKHGVVVGSTFSNLRKNCSTIVSRVIHAANLYSLKWSENHHSFWTPAKIYKLALSVRGTLMTWDEFNDIQTATSGSDLAEGIVGNKGKLINKARSGAYCTLGLPCEYQQQDGSSFQLCEEFEGQERLSGINF